MSNDFKSHKKYKKLARRLAENTSAKGYKTFRMKLPPISSKADLRASTQQRHAITNESQSADVKSQTPGLQKPLQESTNPQAQQNL